MSSFYENCLPHVRKSFVSFPWLHSHPFEWFDHGPMITRNRETRCRWYLNLVLVIACHVFVVSRTFLTYTSPVPSSLSLKFYMAFAALIHSFGAVYHIFIAVTRKDFVVFLKGYIKLLNDSKFLNTYTVITFTGKIETFCGPVGQREFDDRLPANSKKAVGICGLLMLVMPYSCWLSVAASAYLNIAQPGIPQFLTSLIMTNSESILGSLGGITMTLIYVYILLCSLASVPMVTGPLFLFMFSMPDLVKQET